MTWEAKHKRTVQQQLNYQKEQLAKALYHLFNCKLGPENTVYQFSINNSDLFSKGTFGIKTVEGLASVITRLNFDIQYVFYL